MREKIKVLFCAYRNWGLSVWQWILGSSNMLNMNVMLAQNPEQFNVALQKSKFDVIILAGWSWILSDEVVENNFIIGIHPSDLPDYAGGSPIQHQIIDGLEETKATLFKLTPKLDEGPILDKEQLDLSGGMSQIQLSLAKTTITLLDRFFLNYPNIRPIDDYTVKLKGHKKLRRRIKPKDSILTIEKLKKMTCKDLYNFIRCREDPYPNVYMDDETGRIIFKRVEFIKKDD